jgi:hypothetical protein
MSHMNDKRKAAGRDLDRRVEADQTMPFTLLPEAPLAVSCLSTSTESLEQINATRVRVSSSELALPAFGLIEVRS